MIHTEPSNTQAIADGPDTVVVSVVMPMRNEADFIGQSLGSLMEQTFPKDKYEILVMDGGSTDGSREILNDLQATEPALRVFDNECGTVPVAMNLGIRAARGTIIVRADAHTIYPPNYIENCISVLERTGADNVGGPVVTSPQGHSLTARIAAGLLSSRFGVGNSAFRTSMREGYVDTVPFGTFRKELFSRVGYFNELLVRNQDNDLNARIRKDGGRIYMSPELATQYIAPKSLRSLLRQTYRNSKWHVFTVRSNVSALSLRHFVPAAFVVSLCLLSVMSFKSHVAAALLLGVLAAYLLAACCFTATMTNFTSIERLRLPLAFLLFHISYGLGTLAGLRYSVVAPSDRPIRK